MDLQTLMQGNFDPVAAIRLLAGRVAALEQQAGQKTPPPAQMVVPEGAEGKAKAKAEAKAKGKAAGGGKQSAKKKVGS